MSNFSFDSAGYKYNSMQYWMDGYGNMLFGDIKENITISGHLIECVIYPDKKYHCFFLTHPDFKAEKFVLNFNSLQKYKYTYNSGLSISLIFNSEPEYVKLVDECIDFYKKTFPFPLDFAVYFEDSRTFDMARARNMSLSKAKFEHTLMLDLDVKIDLDMFKEMVKLFNSTNHCGVFNLKTKYTSGNGIYFGVTEILKRNSYCAKFKKFWGEDTEFLMNFSRIGYYPMVVNVAYPEVRHDRAYTSQFIGKNNNLFKKILWSQR